MKSKLKFVLDIILSCLYKIHKQREALCLILLIPLAEAKAIFYHYDYKMKAALFFGEYRWVCNVVEDYCNIFIIGIVLWYVIKETSNSKIREAAKFLFVLNALDLIHLGLLDMQYFIIAKLILAYGIYFLWSKLKLLY